MIFQAKDIEAQRRGGATVVTALMWLAVPILFAQSMWLGGSGTTLIPAIVSAVAVTLFWRFRRDSGAGRILSGVLLMAQVSFMVAEASGTPWQLDLHMTYFAMLAVLIIYCDWRVILAATATVAVHHLVLSFVVPAAVFPGSASLTRVLLHAVILIIEAAVLTWVAQSVVRMFTVSGEAVSAAEQAAGEAVAANEAAESARRETDAQRAEAEARDRELQKVQQAVVELTGRGLGALAAGDLTHRLGSDFPEAYGRLRDDFNTAVASLESALGSINVQSAMMRNGTAEIANAAEALAQRTERQAASLEQTAAAMEEITATVANSAKAAERAGGLVGDAHGEALRGGEVVGRAVDAMRDIAGSSTQIEQIIGVIDEIAFQTNLLALNAGVEAARAGEEGRGFAVVASEVRGLAQRSAEAAREIKALISVSSSQVRQGVDLVGQTGEALNAIMARVGEVNEVMEGIVGAARQQASALSEVNTAVTQMDQVTQQNAAMVEETQAACDQLQGVSAELARLVGTFSVSGAGQPASGARALQSRLARDVAA
ncbi:MAG TPA: methyl-accepting chemotaxis protein [Brevundimonas sp.]|jgi:methyl-accepting chemotaxis protein|uniref:methyl-accepting chemotaxis protein n=1 Tax=Brevundimonas sp. TaxID=1871086 RepID=UPI002E115D7B|nr:methyl-accepting chemotaxis protein [Brevundimonas sp.]